MKIRRQPVSRFRLETPSGVIVTNPPYAVRMGQRDETDELYRQMGRVFLADSEIKSFSKRHAIVIR